jgi:hypothetical protein
MNQDTIVLIILEVILFSAAYGLNKALGHGMILDVIIYIAQGFLWLGILIYGWILLGVVGLI